MGASVSSVKKIHGSLLPGFETNSPAPTPFTVSKPFGMNLARRVLFPLQASLGKFRHPQALGFEEGLACL
jgi:hypothetical protein